MWFLNALSDYYEVVHSEFTFIIFVFVPLSDQCEVVYSGFNFIKCDFEALSDQLWSSSQCTVHSALLNVNFEVLCDQLWSSSKWFDFIIFEFKELSD